MNIIRSLFIVAAIVLVLFVIDRALTSPARPATIRLTTEGEVYICDPEFDGDCSLQAIDLLIDDGAADIIISGDPEYGCDYSICECEWQDCYGE